MWERWRVNWVDGAWCQIPRHSCKRIQGLQSGCAHDKMAAIGGAEGLVRVSLGIYLWFEEEEKEKWKEETERREEGWVGAKRKLWTDPKKSGDYN